jgi:hypothetical protein
LISERKVYDGKTCCLPRVETSSIVVGRMIAAACATAADCAYNGVCVSSACVCEPQWQGPRCETLRLSPARKDGGFRSPHVAGEKLSSWGGSILYDETDGKWHMFAAEMANDCGIDYWEPNSRVVHSIADAADGPYAKVSTVLEPFAHEPNAVRAPDGTWVVYLTLRHPDGTQLFNCSSRRNGDRPVPRDNDGPPPPRHTYMVHAQSPYGPWSTPLLVLKANTSIWDNRTVLIDTNLAVAILTDGSAVGIWRKVGGSRPLRPLRLAALAAPTALAALSALSALAAPTALCALCARSAIAAPQPSPPSARSPPSCDSLLLWLAPSPPPRI